MTTPPSYPGVFVSETASDVFFIAASSSAVPIIAAPTATVLADSKEWAGKFGSMTEYLAGTVFSNADPVHVALRAYFENGGAPCYVCKFDKIIGNIGHMPDATLVVAAGQSLGLTKANLQSNKLFAILDANDGAAALTALPAASSLPGEDYAAAYYPWLQAPWSVDAHAVPPSAAVAGAYCANDRDKGVWNTPANVALANLKPKFPVNDTLNAAFVPDTGFSINPIRNFIGRASVIWGGRTLSTNAAWRYISVRRFFLSVERDVQASINSFTFRPNNAHTWELTRGAIDNYLRAIWKAGGLMGAKETDAYWVAVGLGSTMTQDDIDKGIMKVQVGLAAVRPAEFIIIEFSQQVGQG